MTILFTILHVIVSLFLILVVLAQQGKGQDLASAFGGGGSQTAFGARGTATLLSKITAGAAVTFMITSLTLSYLRPATSDQSVIPDDPAATETVEPPASEEGTAGEEAAPPPDAGSEEPPAGDTGEAEEGEGEAGSGEGSESQEPPQP